MFDVFQRIDIRLAGPICSCEGEKLGWSPFVQADGKFGIMIQCVQCGTEYRIPHSKFRATFVLEVPYPEPAVPAKQTTKLEVIDGGQGHVDPNKPKN